MGIFISADPAMDGLNWYTYCANNPMNYVDPWGLLPCDANGNTAFSNPNGDNTFQNDPNHWGLPGLVYGNGDNAGVSTPSPAGAAYSGVGDATSEGPSGPTTTGPSNITGPSTAVTKDQITRVNNYPGNNDFSAKDSFIGSENSGDNGLDIWGEVEASFWRVVNFDFGYDSYQNFRHNADKGNILEAIGWWLCSFAEFAYDTAFVWVAAEYIAGKAGYEGLVLNRNSPVLGNSVDKISHIGFRSEEHLSDHFLRHGKEFGDISKNEYLQRAQELVNSEPSKTILTKIRSNGDQLFYNITKNEFAVKSYDGFIRTFFRPSDGINYFNRQ